MAVGRAMSALLSHDLQQGVDANGDVDIWKGEKAEELVDYLHDAVRRKRGAGGDKAATAAMSLRCFYAYLGYAGRLKQDLATEPVESLSGKTNVAYEAEFAANIWALMHHISVDTTSLPGTGYIEVFRGMYEGTLLSTLPAVHKKCQSAVRNLPQIPSSLLYTAADAVDPITQLHLTVTYCLERDDAAVQSQISQIATDWCAWVISEPETLGEYLLGLCKLSRTAILSKALFLTHLFGVIGGGFAHGSEQAVFVSKLSEISKEYTEAVAVFHSGSAEASQIFARWRALVHGTYNEIQVTPDGAGPGYEPPVSRIRNAAVSVNMSKFYDYLFTVLDIMCLSADITAGGVLKWDEFLAAVIAYMQPDMDLKGIHDWVAGTNSIFKQLGLEEGDVNELPAEDKLIIQILRGDVGEVAVELDVFSVPGLAPHLIEVLSSSEVDNSFANYAASIYQKSPSQWRHAVDYALWSGGVEGRSVYLNILQTIQVDSDGLDYLQQGYSSWRRYDDDGVVAGMLKETVKRHGMQLVMEGKVVEGLRRLMQVEEYHEVENRLLKLLSSWAVDAVSGELNGGGDTLLIPLAEALSSTTLFTWPTPEDAVLKTPISFSKPATSFLDILALVPVVAKLITSSEEQNFESVRDSGMALLQERATPTVLRLASLISLKPLMLDPSICYFSTETTGNMLAALEDILLEATHVATLKEEIAAADIDGLRYAVLAASSKAICFGDTLVPE